MKKCECGNDETIAHFLTNIMIQVIQQGTVIVASDPRLKDRVQKNVERVLQLCNIENAEVADGEAAVKELNRLELLDQLADQPPENQQSA